MKNNSLLIEAFNNDEEVKRLKELDLLINSNEDIKFLFKKVKNLQKQIVNALEYNQTNQHKVYKEEYDLIMEKLLDMPFVEEYLELADSTNEKINNCFKIIEREISKKINE